MEDKPTLIEQMTASEPTVSEAPRPVVPEITSDAAPVEAPVEAPAGTRKRKSRVPKSKQVATDVTEEPPVPTRAQVQSATAELIAEQLAEEAKANNRRATSESAKAQKAAMKAFDESDIYLSRKVHLCELLNAYRARFSEKIVYPWKKLYTPDMALDFLESEASRVRDTLNRIGVPGIIANGILQITAVLSSIGHSFFPGYLDYNAVPGQVAQSLHAGKYDFAIEQLSVEYGAWLASGPWSRMAGQIFSDIRDSQIESFYPPGKTEAASDL